MNKRYLLLFKEKEKKEAVACLTGIGCGGSPLMAELKK